MDERFVRPVMVAVGGDSGTGKTTLTRGLYDIFGAENILNICLDDYHTLDRAQRAERGITPLDPKANDIALMERHAWALRRGERVRKPVYDHGTGTFGPREEVAPRAVVIIRGLFPFFTARLRKAFDVGVWLDPDHELKYHWKVKRDVAQRGYTVPQVIKQIVERQPDVRRHILPQAAHADLVVRFSPPQGYFGDGGEANGHLNVRLAQKRHLPRLDLKDILDAAARDGAPALRLLSERIGDEPLDVLEIDGTVGPAMAADLEERIWDHMRSHRHLRPEEIGTYLEGTVPAHSDPLALTQLLVAYLIVRKREELAASLGEHSAIQREARRAAAARAS